MALLVRLFGTGFLGKRVFAAKRQSTWIYSRANAIAGGRYNTEWKWEQNTLAREIFYLRRAVSNNKFAKVPKDLQCMCLNNLGNRLQVAGRVIEALDCWRRALEVLPNFGMSLCNRARILAAYAEALENRDLHALFLFVAHKEASAALAPTAIYTSRRDLLTREAAKELKERIESILDLKEIDALDPHPLRRKDASPTEEEREYHRWCLVNCLYLNPSNDLGPYTIATGDSIALPTLLVWDLRKLGANPLAPECLSKKYRCRLQFPMPRSSS